MTTKIFDPTKPVQTRDGRKARIICTDKQGSFPIVALILNKTHEALIVYYTDGSSRDSLGAAIDLVNVPVKTSTWENVYSSVCGGAKFTSRFIAEAERALNLQCVGILRRDFEDGVFVKAELVPA